MVSGACHDDDYYCYSYCYYCICIHTFLIITMINIVASIVNILTSVSPPRISVACPGLPNVLRPQALQAESKAQAESAAWHVLLGLRVPVFRSISRGFQYQLHMRTC